MAAGHHYTKRVDHQINRDHQLTEHRKLEAVSPPAEPIHDHRQCSEFEERRDTLPKESLILWSHAVRAHFAVNIGTNRFEHSDQLPWLGAIRGSLGLGDVSQLWQTPRRL